MERQLRWGLTFFVLIGLLGLTHTGIGEAYAETSSQAVEIEVNVIFSGPSLDAFRVLAETFEADHAGVNVVVNRPPSFIDVLFSRVKAGNPPDISLIPNPGQLREFVDGVAQYGESDLVPLDFLRQTLDEQYMDAFVDLGTFVGPDGDARLYGLTFSANVKSLVWYNPNVLGSGFEIDTWDEMMAFTREKAAQNQTAWCIGLESGGGTGWPGTDWIEDVLMQTAGPIIYDAWVAHDIPWTDERIKWAWELFGRIVRNPDYVLGGPEGAVGVNYQDSPNGLFTDPPGCYLHRQASFIQKAHPDLTPIEDFNVFPFPRIDASDRGRTLIGGGSILGMFRDTPENRDFMRFLASAEAQEIWIERGGQESPANAEADLRSLDPISERITRLLRTAEHFRYDASDLMPSALGSGAFWTQVIDFVLGKDVCAALRSLEATAERVYDAGAATNGMVEDGACPAS